MRTLYELTGEMLALETQLEENGGELTPELEELWQDNAEALVKKTDNYNTLLKNFEAHSSNLDAEIKRLQALKKTDDNAIKRIKEHLLNTMQTFGIEELKGDFCKITIAKSTATEVDEEAALYNFKNRIEEFRDSLPSYIKVTTGIDKTEAKRVAKETGIVPAGIEFIENKSLRIR